LAYKKGVLTESDIRVLDNYSKKNHSDLVPETDPDKNAGNRKNRQEPDAKT